MTTLDLQGTIARAAVGLNQARGLLVQVRDKSAREWPEEMVNEVAQPSLEYRIYIDARMLLEEYVEPGLSLARDTSSLTDGRTRREWQADRDAAARGQEEMAALFAAQENGDNPVPYFLDKVEAVMTAAHALRGRKPLTLEERATLSTAIRLQAALHGEESLGTYIARALNERDSVPPDDLEDMSTSVRVALVSLSKSALGFSAMLRRASDLGLETGIGQEAMTAITEAIEELDRRVAALDSPEDA